MKIKIKRTLYGGQPREVTLTVDGSYSYNNHTLQAFTMKVGGVQVKEGNILSRKLCVTTWDGAHVKFFEWADELSLYTTPLDQLKVRLKTRFDYIRAWVRDLPQIEEVEFEIKEA